MRAVRISTLAIAGLWAVVATAAAQAPAPAPGAPPGAFGVLGMYPQRLTCADLPTFSPPRIEHRLTTAQDGNGALRRAFAAPDSLIVPGGMGAGLQVGQRFFVRRLLPSATHATPSTTRPGVVHTAGWISIVGADTNAAVAHIDHACDGFQAGDYLEPFAPTPMPPAVAPPGPPTFEGMGQLLFGNDGRRSFANGDLIVVNRGATHGVTAGARLSIYRDVKTGGPLVPVGQAIVLTTGADTATVIADRVRDVLMAGDFVALQAPAPR